MTHATTARTAVAEPRLLAVVLVSPVLLAIYRLRVTTLDTQRTSTVLVPLTASTRRRLLPADALRPSALAPLTLTSG